MERRNTIQKELVLSAVTKMRRHVTADDVYDFIRSDYPAIGKGTVYRNLGILAEENKIRRIEIPNAPDVYDFRLDRHYHVRCLQCGKVSDVDMDVLNGMQMRIHDDHGFAFLDYEILFKGICPDCLKSRREQQ